MTGQQILYVLFCFLPFVVCLFWFACFMVHCCKNDQPKHYLTVYLLTCTVLYLCHGVFFTLGLPYALECLWTLCSLSVYPLFYGYLCRLTSSDYRVRQLLPWLVPGAMVAAAKYALPDAGIDHVRLLLFTVQIVTVVYFGIRKLKEFDRRLQSVYADTEGRDTEAVHNLLVAIAVEQGRKAPLGVLTAAKHHPRWPHLSELAGHSEHVLVGCDAGAEQEFRFAAAQQENVCLGQNVPLESRKGGLAIGRQRVHQAGAVGGYNAWVDHYPRAAHDVVAQSRHGGGIAHKPEFDGRRMERWCGGGAVLGGLLGWLDQCPHLPRHNLCRKGMDALNAAETLHRD